MTEPVTLTEAKLFLRVTHDAEDGLIETLIAAAKGRVEQATGLTLDEAAPAALRLAMLKLIHAAYEGEAEGDVAAWIAPWRTVRL